MEKIENRKQYLNNLKNFSKKVKLSETFLQKLRDHQYFADYMEVIDVFMKQNFKINFFLKTFSLFNRNWTQMKKKKFLFYLN
jgi:hypothetical protein